MITDFVHFISAFQFWLRNALEDHLQSACVSCIWDYGQFGTISVHHSSNTLCSDLHNHSISPISPVDWCSGLFTCTCNGCDRTESERDRIASISILTITPMPISCTRPEHHGMILCVSVIADWVRKWDTCFADVPLVFAEQVNAFCLDRPPHRFI